MVDEGDVSIPTEPSALFGREGPLAVEIGFGSGGFLRSFAGDHPRWNVLGVEISPASHARAYPSVRDEELRNVRLFQGTGEFVVRDVLPSESIRTMFVHFPDPWPKEKHRDRRLLTSDFLRAVAARLAPDGRLQLTTDHDGYFEWSLERVSSLSCLDAEVGEPPEAVRTTKYAKKWRREGRDFQHARIERSGPAPEVARQIEESNTMHHATLEGSLPEAVDPSTLETLRLENGVVAVRDIYRRAGGNELLVLLHIEEADLIQRMMVEIVPRDDHPEGRVTVRMRRFNQPLTTDGTSRAIEHVAEWVASLHPDNEFVDRQY